MLVLRKKAIETVPGGPRPVQSFRNTGHTYGLVENQNFDRFCRTIECYRVGGDRKGRRHLA